MEPDGIYVVLDHPENSSFQGAPMRFGICWKYNHLWGANKDLGTAVSGTTQMDPKPVGGLHILGTRTASPISKSDLFGLTDSKSRSWASAKCQKI
jgi:hypothetical protein